MKTYILKAYAVINAEKKPLLFETWNKANNFVENAKTNEFKLLDIYMEEKFIECLQIGEKIYLPKNLIRGL
jgi:hypothetical protein